MVWPITLLSRYSLSRYTLLAIRIEDLADLRRQILGRKRLGQKRLPFIQNTGPHDRLVGIARDVQHAHRRAQCPERLEDRRPAHVAKDDITERQIEVARVIAPERKAGPA